MKICKVCGKKLYEDYMYIEMHSKGKKECGNICIECIFFNLLKTFKELS
jgi:hypothetical protein